VAIDHTHSDPAVTAADSMGLWKILDRMEVIFGLDLFQPVPEDPSWSPDVYDWTPVPGVISAAVPDEFLRLAIVPPGHADASARGRAVPMSPPRLSGKPR
jgi:hypothetical protein